MTPEQAEAEFCRRVGLSALILLQAATLLTVAFTAPFWVAVSYGGIGGSLIAQTLRHLREPAP